MNHKSFTRIMLLSSLGLLSSCQLLQTNEHPMVSLDEKVDTTAQQIFKNKPKNSLRKKDNSNSSLNSEKPEITPDNIDLTTKNENDSIATIGQLPGFQTKQHQQPKPPQNFTADEVIKLDYEQVDIRQILQELSDALGLTLVIDPSISGKLTMRTSPNQPLTQKDLWPVLNLLLNEAGIILEEKAGVYYAKRSPNALPADIGYQSIVDNRNPAVAMQLTPIKNISSDEAIAIIKNIVQNDVRIGSIPNLNMLTLVGSSEKLQRVNALLKVVDVNAFKHRSIRLYKIKKAEAKSIADELKNVLTLIEGKKPAYQVLGLERINAVLVVAPPRRGFKEITRWVNILDEGSDNSLQQQVFIYHCKSVNCETLAGTLNSVFEKTDQNKNVPKKEDNSPNVFRTVPKDSLNVKAKNKTQPQTTSSQHKQNETTKNSGGTFADIDANIVADSNTNALIVKTSGRDYRNLLETIKMLDRTPLQVLVNVVLAQVSLDKSHSLGLDWKVQTNNDLLQSNLGKASVVASGQPLGLVMSGVKGNLMASINALASSGDVNILSRPSLLIANNQEGVIKVGQEVPVQTSSTTNLDNSTATTLSTSTQVSQEISYRNTGIELAVTPHINEDGIVTLEISQSLSAISGSVNSQDASYKPTFTNQDLTTTAIVADGETFILGGLIDSVKSYTDTGLPLLKDIPLLGQFFKTQDESEQRRELMLIITPRIIGPETNLSQFGQEFMRRFESLGAFVEQELQGNY